MQCQQLTCLQALPVLSLSSLTYAQHQRFELANYSQFPNLKLELLPVSLEKKTHTDILHNLLNSKFNSQGFAHPAIKSSHMAPRFKLDLLDFSIVVYIESSMLTRRRSQLILLVCMPPLSPLFMYFGKPLPSSFATCVHDAQRGVIMSSELQQVQIHKHYSLCTSRFLNFSNLVSL